MTVLVEKTFSKLKKTSWSRLSCSFLFWWGGWWSSRTVEAAWQKISLDESILYRKYYFSSTFHQPEGLRKGYFETAHEICHDKSGTSWHSCHTMNQNVGPFGFLSQQRDSSFEERWKIERLMVNSWDIEIFDVLWHRFWHIFALDSCYDCANLMS